MKDSKLFKVFQLGGYTPTNLENFNYVPTYAGKPLETQKFVGDRMVDLFNTNLAQASAVDIMNAQRQVVDGDTEANETISKRYKEELDAIAKSGDYENMSMRVNALARRYQTDPEVKAVSESRANFDREQKMAEEIRMRTGKEPLFMGDAGKHRTITVDPETGKKTFNVFRSEATADLDKQKKRQDIWSVIQPDMGPLSQAQVRTMLPSIAGFISTGVWKGISGGPNGKIAQLLNSAVSAYQSTAEYRQEKKLLESEGDTNPEQTIRKKMFDEGLLKTFSQVDPQYMQDWLLREAMQGQKATDPAVSDLAPALKISQIAGFDPEDRKVKARTGNRGAAGVAGTLPGTTGMSKESNLSYTGEKQGLTPAEIKAGDDAALSGAEIFGGKEAVARAIEQGSDFYSTPEAQEYREKYAELLKVRYQYPRWTVFTDNEDLTKANNEVQGSLDGRMIVDINNVEGGTIPAEDVLELVDGNSKKLNVVGFTEPKNSYGKIAGDERLSDAYVMQAGGKKFLVTRADSWYRGEGALNTVINRAYNNLGLNPGKIQTFNLAGIEVQAKLIPDLNNPDGGSDRVVVFKLGNEDFSSQPLETDANGNPMTLEGFVYGVIKKAQSR